MLNKNLVLFFFTCNLIFAQNPWQLDSGQWLISPYVSFYQAESMRDNSGDKTTFGNNGEFSSYNPRLYFSTSLNGYKLNLFGTVPYFINQYADHNSKIKNKKKKK